MAKKKEQNLRILNVIFGETPRNWLKISVKVFDFFRDSDDVGEALRKFRKLKLDKKSFMYGYILGNILQSLRAVNEPEEFFLLSLLVGMKTGFIDEDVAKLFLPEEEEVSFNDYVG